MANNFLGNSISNSDLSTETTSVLISDTLLEGIDVNLDESNVVGQLPMNLVEISGNPINTDNGIALNSQRVVIANDNDEIDMNQTQINGNAMTTGLGLSVQNATQRVATVVDNPYQNNYENYYNRTFSGQNNGQPELWSGMCRSVGASFHQLSFNLASNQVYTNPIVEVDLQLSSDAAPLTTQTVEVEAWKKDGNIIKSNPITLNGQNAVPIIFPSAEQVFRVKSMTILTNTMTGNLQTGANDAMYCSPVGTVLNSGTPTLGMMFSARVGYGGGGTSGGQYFLSSNKIAHTMIANFSSDSDAARSLLIAIQFKEATGSLWYTRNVTGLRGKASFTLPCSPVLEAKTEGMDLRVLVQLGDGASGGVQNAYVGIHLLIE
jgi:hypothetical protein